MADATVSPSEEEKLTKYIITQVRDRGSGRHSSECLNNYPRDVYFIGNLRSQDPGPQQAQVAPHLPELMNKLAPVAFGAEFLVAPGETAVVRVRVRWASYYRVFPTYDQQVAYQKRTDQAGGSTGGRRVAAVQADDMSEAGEDSGEEKDDNEPLEEDKGDLAGGTQQADAEGGNGSAATTQGAQRKDAMRLRFRKLPCLAEGDVLLRPRPEGSRVVDAADFEAAISAELTRAHDVVVHDPETFRAGNNAFDQARVPESALKTAATYQAFLGTLRTPVVPVWRWDTRFALEATDDPSRALLSAVFANDSPRQLSPVGKDHPHIETYLFDTCAEFSFHNCSVEPFSIELAPPGFRYDRYLPARGFNCAVTRRGSANFRTDHMPVFTQQRYQTRTDPPADFATLSTDPVPVLDNIGAAMEGYRSTWKAGRDHYKAERPDWEKLHANEFDRDARQFDDEIARFGRGRDLIRDNADVRLAFKLTNETFNRGPRSSWRLFQIVFLVSQLPGLTALAGIPGSDPAERDIADIIYFPTGGGKTEAYLAVLVFQCFFDRLRGKTAGVTAWIRFPLRLLTLQQTQRVADVICLADLVRREQPDPRLSCNRVAPFAVGYFVGQTSTPNELVDADHFRYARAREIETWRVASDPAERQRWRRLITCPSCRTATVQLNLDVDKVRIIHRCTNPRCSFPDGHIPIYVIDNEIYRYLPTVLVGTLDKMAGIGNQRKMALLFGDVDGYCQKHGYYKNRCCQRECDNKKLTAHVPAGLSGPTLFLQDELHLLKEGLGTFDGHYETFVTELLAHIRPGHRVKLIASSATIENFRRQLEHLYGVDPAKARMFPGPGPSLGQSFYAVTLDYPQRLYVGILPHNKTIFNTMLELLELYHAILQELYKWPAASGNPYGGQISPGTTAWFALLDLYVTSLTYFLASRELSALRTDIENHVALQLQMQGHEVPHILELTGSTSTNDVAHALEYLAQPKPAQERSTIVLATNMVSHGVDLDRLNAMFFYGMPRQNAEYIQASSRVGRTNVGMVFVCHYPARERDQSHYGFFHKFHEYLGQMIEPVAINRWAKFSINRTLPGLFMAVLLQVLSNRDGGAQCNRYYRADHVRSLVAGGSIKADDFIPILEQAYLVNADNDIARKTFRAEIRLRVQQFLDLILSTDREWVSDALIPRPMTSLRDVDDPIPIHLDQSDALWGARTDR